MVDGSSPLTCHVKPASRSAWRQSTAVTVGIALHHFTVLPYGGSRAAISAAFLSLLQGRLNDRVVNPIALLPKSVKAGSHRVQQPPPLALDQDANGADDLETMRLTERAV